MKKISVFVLTIALLILYTSPIFAVEVIGQVLSTDIRAYINGAEIPAYNIDGKLAVVVSDLNNYGFITQYNNDLRRSSVTRNPSTSAYSSVPSKASGLPIGSRVMDVYRSDITVELNGKPVQAFNVDNRMAIYFSELKMYGDYWYDNNSRSSYLSLTGGSDINSVDIYYPNNNYATNSTFAHLVDFCKTHGTIEDGSYKVHYKNERDEVLESIRHRNYYIIYSPNSDELIIEINFNIIDNSRFRLSHDYYVNLVIPSSVPSVLNISVYDAWGDNKVYYGTINTQTFSGVGNDITFASESPDLSSLAVLVQNALFFLDQNTAIFGGDASADGVKGLGFTALTSLRSLANLFNFQLSAESYVTSSESYPITNQDYVLKVRKPSWSPRSHMLKIGFINAQSGTKYAIDIDLHDINDNTIININSVGLPAGNYYVLIYNTGTATISGSIQYWVEKDY